MRAFISMCLTLLVLLSTSLSSTTLLLAAEPPPFLVFSTQSNGDINVPTTIMDQADENCESCKPGGFENQITPIAVMTRITSTQENSVTLVKSIFQLHWDENTSNKLKISFAVDAEFVGGSRKYVMMGRWEIMNDNTGKNYFTSGAARAYVTHDKNSAMYKLNDFPEFMTMTAAVQETTQSPQ